MNNTELYDMVYLALGNGFVSVVSSLMLLIEEILCGMEKQCVLWNML